MSTNALIQKLKTAVLALILMVTSFGSAFASSGNEDEKFNAGEMALHHVMDAYEWHLYDSDHYGTFYLPIILYSNTRGLLTFSSSNFYDHHELVEYNGLKLDSHGHIASLDPNEEIFDFSITKNVASALFSVVLLVLIFTSAAKGYKKNEGKAPSGVQSFVEPLILFVRDDIAKTIIGHKYEKFVPYLLTLFFFIFINNLLGLMPGAANVTGNIAVTLVLAVFTLIVTNINGNKNYWQHIFATPGVPFWLLPIMIPIELIGIFTKPFALMVRLFANITAGHIVILSIIGLTFLFKSIFIAPASVVLGTAMMFLELMVAFIQAYVFTLLSSIYISSAVEDHH
ncbi:F0F1 ATP synthase subunit A [Aureibacter tunicatorum]|uniref:ATP synthase subunit a n=1 Tax=Aureibacter tunicatorum TaxID=866807 RepID=A0AAE3XK03_9BACT|nr:F0F1 ATP synthase subunit A [Aureibacter tunicatorum]MDR6237196.1 F-type H+-transporting ATPase subunit a [Aureibacter tunicatorum]BDD06188.1 ATP synthase subunit a [Aureibacter tunicatorum]